MSVQPVLYEQTQALQETFSRLAGCFYPPGPGLKSDLQDLPDVVESLSIQAAEAAGQLLQSLDKQCPDELLKEYSRLFIGPFQLDAPPFGSVYLESGGRLMGASTAEVSDLYRQCGLDLSPDFKNPPDHVAAELEFLAYLYYRENNGQEAKETDFFREQRERFLLCHIGAWFPDLDENIKEHSQLDFYCELSQLTRQLLQEEGLRLKAGCAVHS